MGCVTRWFVWVALAVVSGACDSGGGGGRDGGRDGGHSAGEGEGEGDGTAVAPWTDYCVATFTEDHQIEGHFGDVELTVQSGEAYLLADFEEDMSEIYYLTRFGPVGFDIEPAEDGTWPFTSNCEPGATLKHYGVFVDTVLYEEAELMTPVCQLFAGTAAPTLSSGFAIAGDLDFDGGGTPYKVFLGGLADLCDGRTEAFLSVRLAVVGSGNHTAIPIQTFRAPPE